MYKKIKLENASLQNEEQLFRDRNENLQKFCGSSVHILSSKKVVFYTHSII